MHANYCKIQFQSEKYQRFSSLTVFRFNGMPITVRITPNVDCKLGKKATSIRVHYDGNTANSVPVFTKDGPNRLLLTWPGPETSPTPVRPISNGTNNGYNNYTNGNGANNGNNNITNNRGISPTSKPNAPPPPVPNRVQSINANNGNGNGYRRN